MKIQVIHGPNLNMLGIREPEIYGKMTMQELNDILKKQAEKWQVEIEFYQSNSEGSLIDKIHFCHNKMDGIIINPGAYTHYSYAIHDAIASISTPTIEVHLSDIQSREEFRKISVVKDACIKQISGKGIDSYVEALEYFVNK